MRTKIILAAILLLQVKFSAANSPEEGTAIFKTRCAGCHNVNQIMTGIALDGLYLRTSLDCIIAFVQTYQSMIKKGDAQDNELYQKFNKIIMPDHADLNADHIKNIVAYIKSEAKTSDNVAPFAKPIRQ